MNEIVVTLIPKTTDAKCIKDYRLITDCTTIYKIISKIMTNRLVKVLPSIIDINQDAFVPGQIIQNHIMMAIELMRGYSRKGGTPRCMIQHDLQKAYDMMDWGALQLVLKEICMPQMFIHWILIVLNTVTYRFNTNGTVSKEIQARRGLRQGDPHIPFALCDDDGIFP